MKNTMRHTLLATVAATALIAGAGLALAQGPGENREAPGAATHEPKLRAARWTSSRAVCRSSPRHRMRRRP